MKLWEVAQRLPTQVVVGLVRVHQRTLSRVLPPTCRFQPSCSTYTIEAVERHGVLRGVLLGLWRVARCNPFNAGGLDPVPPRRNRQQASPESAEQEPTAVRGNNDNARESDY